MLLKYGRRVWFKMNESAIIEKLSESRSALSRLLAPKPENSLEIKTILRRLSSELGALGRVLEGDSGKARKELGRLVNEALKHDRIDMEMQDKLEKVCVELSGLETELRLMAEQKKVSP